MKSSLLVVLMLAVCSCAALAQQTIDGSTLQDKCRAVTKAPEQMTASEIPKTVYCLAYIRATVDAFTFAVSADTNHDLDIYRACVPKEVTTGQEAQVIVKWLDAHPELLHWNGSLVVMAAIRNAFPCKQ